MRFDRSWIPGIITLLAVVILRRQVLGLPAEIRSLIGLAIAGWLVWTGIQILRGRNQDAFLSRAAGPKVQYWRGQRIVLEEERPRSARLSLRLPPWPVAASALLCVLIGLGAVLILVGDFLDR